MRRIASALLFIAGAAAAQPASEALIARGRAMTATDPCAGGGEEVVVCGQTTRQATDRFRLPLPAERPAHLERDVAGIDPARAAQPCGLFAGQRRCAKAEARAYGLGGGADPLTALSRIGIALLDSDADGPAPTPASPMPR